MAKSESPIDNVLKYIKSNGIKFVDLKFMDFPGQWQHFTVPVSHFNEGSFEDGYGFDGSSIRGWKPINEKRSAWPGSFVATRSASNPALRRLQSGKDGGARERASHNPFRIEPTRRQVKRHIQRQG